MFLGFIIWIIYLANTAQNSVFFELVASIPFGDKLGHFLLFGLLTLAANFVFKLKKITLFSINIYAGSVIVFFFALIEELSQHFIASRTLDANDFIADIIGIVVFSVLTKRISRHLNSVNQNIIAPS
jgi:VanZ family protein